MMVAALVDVLGHPSTLCLTVTPSTLCLTAPHPPCSFVPCSAGVMVSAGFCHLLGEALRAMPQIRVGAAGDWWVLLGKQRVGMWQCRSPAMAAARHTAGLGGCWPAGCSRVWTGHHIPGVCTPLKGRAASAPVCP